MSLISKVAINSIFVALILFSSSVLAQSIEYSPIGSSNKLFCKLVPGKNGSIVKILESVETPKRIRKLLRTIRIRLRALKNRSSLLPKERRKRRRNRLKRKDIKACRDTFTPDESNGPKSGDDDDDDSDPGPTPTPTPTPPPPAPACGDAILDFGEECDDGNLLRGDGCSELCEFEIYSTANTLGVTRNGSLYHRDNCSPTNNDGKLLLHIVGTRGNNEFAPRTIFEHVGGLTGRCMIAPKYNNAISEAECCTEFDVAPGINHACRREFADAK